MSAPDIPLANPAAGLAEHKHCEVCGKSIALDGRVCSPECVAKLQVAIKMKKRSVLIFVVLFAIILGITVLPMLASKGGP